MASITTRTRNAKAVAVNEPKYPCGNSKCSTEVNTDGIQCDTCNTWYHRKCSCLATRAYNIYAVHKYLKWICKQCIEHLRQCIVGKICTGTTQESKVIQHLDKETDCQDLGVDAEEGVKMDGKGKQRLAKQSDSQEVTDSNSSEWIMIGKAKKGRDVKGKTQTKVKGKPAKTDDIASKSGLSLGEIGKTLADQERWIRELQMNVDMLKKNNDIALGRNRNVVIRGILEPYVKESRQRMRDMRHHVSNLLRMANLLPQARIKRILRLGKWAKDRPPRPIVVEFENQRIRDRFLAAAGDIKRLTEGRTTLEPDDSAHWKRQAGELNESSNPATTRRSSTLPSIRIPRAAAPTETTEPVTQRDKLVIMAKDKKKHKAGKVTVNETSSVHPADDTVANLIDPKNGKGSRT